MSAGMLGRMWQHRRVLAAALVSQLVLSCTDDLASTEDGPSACIGGEFCVGDLVCIDGFCVPPSSETGESGGDCELGSEGCDCAANDTCDPGLICVDGLCELDQCGNGVKELNEACDDGNDDNTDTCLDTCELASCGDGFVGPGEGCDDGNMIDDDACSNDCALTSCGDGVVQAPEQCDDGNTDNTDACLSTCVEASCGDGVVQQDVEDCDDANPTDTDDCTSTCLDASCGDGFVHEGVEDCDDGNADNTDACVDGCVPAECGDGFVQQGVEDCDDGNMVNTDTCVAGCVAASCGDGFVGPGEGCDDGNMVDDDACSNDCALASCGDGVVQPGEACDDGNMVDTDACLSSCVAASCGDGFVQAGVEQCDDGNIVNTDACLSSCDTASCGDGFVWAGVEACDDQNLDETDACVSTCELAACGDGFVQPGNNEVCDDGNLDPMDGCEPGCDAFTPLGLVSIGYNTNCAVLLDGSVRCWGWNGYYNLATATPGDIGDMPNEMPPPPSILGGTPTTITLGWAHGCALFNPGVVRCWGYGGLGSLGYNNTNTIGDQLQELPPANVNVGGTVVSLDTGERHNCAVLDTGKLKCWGWGIYGQLGHGNITNIGDNGLEMPPPDVAVGGTVVQVSAGLGHTCVLLDTNNVRCWGENDHGQLGYGHTNRLGNQPGELPTPNIDVGPGVVLKVVADGANTCVLFTNGNLRCWGSNMFGQLGQGDTLDRGDQPGEMPPPNIATGGNVVDFVAGPRVCVLLDDGSVRCWGTAEYGALGYGDVLTLGDQPGEMPPPAVNLGGLVTELFSSSAGWRTCARMLDHSLRCWGYGAAGALGYGSTDHVGDMPNEMPPGHVPLY